MLFRSLDSALPDRTTIMNFRHLLEQHQLARQLFKTVNRWLTEAGVMMIQGTLVDATIIGAPRSTKNNNASLLGRARNSDKHAKSESALLVHSVPSTRYRERLDGAETVSPSLDRKVIDHSTASTSASDPRTTAPIRRGNCPAAIAFLYVFRGKQLIMLLPSCERFISPDCRQQGVCPYAQ